MTLLSGQNLASLADEIAGVTALTMQRDESSAITAGTSGTLYAQLITLPPGLPVNNLDFWMVGASTAPSHQWMALMTAGFPLSSGGQVVAVTGDAVPGQAANTYYRLAVTSPPPVTPFVTPPGSASLWYIGLMLAAGTVGTVAGGPATPNINSFFGGASGLPKFITAGAGFTTPPALGTAMAYTAASGASSNFYAATA